MTSNTFIFFLLTSSLLSQVVSAKTLPANKSIFRQDFSYTASQALWENDSKKVEFRDEDGELGTQEFYEFGLSLLTGIKNGYQFDVRLSYAQSKLKGSSFVGAEEGGGQSAINQIYFNLTKSIIDNKIKSLDLSLGYKHPGQTELKRPMFLSLNDYSNDIILGARYQFESSEKVSLLTQIQYIHRIGPAYDQIHLSFVAPTKYLGRGWSLSPGVHYVNTIDGLDINSSEFDEEALDSGFEPFHKKQEKFTSLSLGVGRVINTTQWIELAVNKKIWGRNSNLGTTATIALNTLL